MNRKKLLAPLLAGAMLLGLVAPVPAAAAANKVVEIPVNFTNSDWEDDWDTTSRTEMGLWGFSEPGAYSESYTVSYKLYVPESYIKDGSAINLGTCLNFDDAEDDGKYGGYAECPMAEFQSDGRFTRFDEATETDVPIDYATAKKSNGYWVFSYKANSGELHAEDTDASKASSVDVSFNLSIKGIKITAKNKAVYLDDLKITRADGTTAVNQNFDSLKNLKDNGEAEAVIAPNLDWEKDSKELKLATLPDLTPKTLTVAKTKLTVKVGKKVTIKATTKPSAKITYKSSNTKVATVNSKGVVTGKKAGKATITVKANGKTVKVTVTVKK